MPFDAPYRLVVDGAHDQEFVSGGPNSDELAVMDGTGALASTIPMQGAAGMSLVGSELYVAEAAGDDLAIVDTASTPPAISGKIGIGRFTQPRDLTYVDGRLWFLAHEGLVTVRTDGTGLDGRYLRPPRTAGLNSSQLMFVDGLDHETQLMMFDGSSVYRYTATTPPIRISSFGNAGNDENDKQVTVLPGDASFAVAGGGAYKFPDVQLTDGEILRNYDAAAYPTAVAATSAAGGLVGGGAMYGSLSANVWAYRIDDPTAFFSAIVGGGSESPSDRGIAWSASGDRLFVVTTSDPYHLTATFYVVTPTGLPSVESSTLTVAAAPDPVPTGSPVDITVHLDGGDTNRDVQVWAQPIEGSRSLIASGTVDGSGDFIVHDYAPMRTTTFTASYAGDASWGGATTARTVQVTSTTHEHLSAYKEKVGRYAVYSHNGGPTLAAHVDPTFGDCSGVIKVRVDTATGWSTFRSWPLQYSNGSVETTLPLLNLDNRYRVRVVSDACRYYLPSISGWHYFRFI